MGKPIPEPFIMYMILETLRKSMENGADTKASSASTVLSDLRADRDRLRSELTEVERTIGFLEARYAGRPLTLTTARGMTIAEAAEKVLRESNRPLSTAEITEAILKQGVQLSGETPSNTVSTTLSREASRASATIIKAGRALWSVKSEDHKPQIETNHESS
jgi:hypothetical protein